MLMIPADAQGRRKSGWETKESPRNCGTKRPVRLNIDLHLLSLENEPLDTVLEDNRSSVSGSFVPPNVTQVLDLLITKSRPDLELADMVHMYLGLDISY